MFLSGQILMAFSLTLAVVTVLGQASWYFHILNDKTTQS